MSTKSLIADAKTRMDASVETVRRELAILIVRDDDVTGQNILVCADDRHVDGAEAGFDRALSANAFAPNRKAHIGQCRDVTDASVDDQPLHTMGLQ